MPTGRARLREELIAAARADDDVVGAALVGSVAAGREDDWSDIDLVLQVARDVDPATVAARWTERLYERGAVDHLDVIAGGVLYRVFLLASSLQVDLSFWPEDAFRGTEPGFELLFGTPQPATPPNDPDTPHYRTYRTANAGFRDPRHRFPRESGRSRYSGAWGEAGEHGQQQQGTGLVQRGVVVPALG